jgi:MoxR-like ATPase
MQQLVREVPWRHVQDYALRVLQATHPTHGESPDSVRKFVRYGGVAARPKTLLAAKTER